MSASPRMLVQIHLVREQNDPAQWLPRPISYQALQERRQFCPHLSWGLPLATGGADRATPEGRAP